MTKHAEWASKLGLALAGGFFIGFSLPFAWWSPFVGMAAGYFWGWIIRRVLG